ncbi:MAG: acetyl-CoA synthetase [Methanomassiliicoccales archaeon]|nr:acetyl-CoA synthetase [Methanomassiliicoccales archaeon]NYT15169.1 acetyl-CoA synthetase [Methanomassiliicoccales archaeon]
MNGGLTVVKKMDILRMRKDGRTTLSEAEAKSLLREWGIPTTNFLLPKREELASLRIRFPVAVKVSSPNVLHKTDQGGVFIDVKDWEELTRRFDTIERRFPEGQVLVESMEEGNAEFIVGLLKDPVFGLIIMFGTGGVLTELYQDISFRKVPITPEDADEMMDEIKAGKLLRGFRGIKADRGAVKQILLEASDMGIELEEHINQIDLNPVIVKEHGCVVVDAKIIFEPLEQNLHVEPLITR